LSWVILTDDHLPLDGGVATWTGWATEALRTRGAVRVYARKRPGLEGAIGVSGRSFGRWGGWHLARAAFRELRQAEGVLATTWTVATGAVRVLPRRTPLHVVVHGSELQSDRPSRAFLRVADRAQLWAVSRFLVDKLGDWGVSARVLPVPIPQQPGSALGDRWTMVARAIPMKAGERFVRLVAGSGGVGEVVGGGPMLGRWRVLAEQLGASIHFSGRVDRQEVWRAYERSKLVFLLSRESPHGEGLGLTLLEAAARGIPTVGSASGGIPEAASLVLERPDDVAHSLESIAAWQGEGRGDEAREWVESTHGVQRFLDAVEGHR